MAMQRGNTPQSESEEGFTNVEIAFSCKHDKTHILHQLLSTLLVKKDTQANVKITAQGIKFTVDDSKIMQINLALKPDDFQEYYIAEKDSFEFRIPLAEFLECLNLFGGSISHPTSVHILYMGPGTSLIMVLTDPGASPVGVTTATAASNTAVTADISMSTMPSEDVLNFDFRGCPIPDKVIMQSASLKEALNELDWSSSHVNFTLSPDLPHFRLETGGEMGSCQVDYPKESEIFEAFDCQQIQSNSYKLELLQPSIKALQLASKTQVRVNQRGVLNLQHMIKLEDKHLCFIDIFILPSDEEEDGTSAMILS